MKNTSACTKALVCLMLAVLMGSASVVPAMAAVSRSSGKAPKYMYVHNPSPTSDTYLWSLPDDRSQVRATLYYGAAVRFQGYVDSNWVKVSVQELTGYIRARNLDYKPFALNNPPHRVFMRVTASAVNIRALPTSRADDILTSYPRGTRVELLGYSGGWYFVRKYDRNMNAGWLGFIDPRYLRYE